MIVACPSCETKFEIPDDKYRPGRKARCSNCGFVFPLPELPDDDLPGDDFPGEDTPAAPGITRPAPKTVPDIALDSPPSAPPGSSVDAAAAFLEDDFPPMQTAPSPAAADKDANGASGAEGGDDLGDAFFTPDDETADAEAAEEEPAENGKDADATPSPASPASVEDVVAPAAKAEKASGKKRNKKKLLLILGIVLVVALLCYGGVLVYSVFFASPKGADPQRATDGKVVESLGGRTSALDQEKEAARLAAVSRLALVNVRQHTVTENDKAGPMVVVEGAVANNFETPKDLILLEITLYDNKGNPLVLREQYCGVTLSLLQLRTLSKAAIESALANQVVILRNNTDILPGSRVPFTTVFFDLPSSAYEFEVKIVDVQDPAANK